MTPHPIRANYVQGRRQSRGSRSPSVRSGWRAAPALALVAVLVALAVSGGSGAAAGSNTTGRRVTGSVANRAVPGATLRIERADIHVDNLADASEFEMDLAITQTQDDCDTPPQGQLCLRYTISTDDIASEDGYGLIPIAAVRVSPSTITLSIDTRHDPHMHLMAGQGGLISLTWYMPLGLPHPEHQAATLAVATVQGSMLGYTIPSTNVTAAVLMSPTP